MPRGIAQAEVVTYELHTIGWNSFQDLCASVASEILGQTVQTFSAVNDAGRDGAFWGTWRPTDNERLAGSFVIQCKHTSKLNVSLTVADLKDEIKKARRLAAQGLADNYILITNYGVSGRQESDIKAEFLKLPGLKAQLTFGRKWISDKIRESPRLRMMVPRVYGLGDLSQILDARAYDQARDILSSLGEDLATFVITDAYRDSVRAIQEHGIVLLLGEPASGKSTIAATLSMGAIDNWGCSTLKVRTPGEFKAHWNPHERSQFFWIDDAFGATQYDRSLALSWSSVFPEMKAALHGGAKIVMTSRNYIFNAAALDLKSSALPVLNRSQVIIRVADFSLREKSQILYNHLKLGKQPSSFRKAVKSYLDSVAQNSNFLPETARRIGDPMFTKALQTTPTGLVEFFESPLSLLIDVLRELDSHCKAAIAIIFMNGGAVTSPVSLSYADKTAVTRMGSSVQGVLPALTHLKGSLLKLVYSEGVASWTYRHPTVADAFASLVAENPEFVDIYLTGAKIDKIANEVMCGDVDVKGAKINVPAQKWNMLCDRLHSEATTQSVCSFLGSRCSPKFVKQYVSKYPDIYSFVSSPGSYLHATLQSDLIEVFEHNGLLPSEWREQLIQNVERLAIDTPDADFFLVDRVRQVFTEEELDRFRKVVRTEVLPCLTDVVSNWSTDYDGTDEPESHFQLLDEVINAYESEFKGDEWALDLITKAQTKIASEIDYATQYYEELNPPQQPDGDEETYIQRDVGARTARSIFDDVDE